MWKKACSIILAVIISLSAISVLAETSDKEEIIYTGDGYTISRIEITEKYDVIKGFNNGLACVGIYKEEQLGLSDRIDGLYGFIDENAELVFPMVKGDKTGKFIDGLASLGYSYVNSKGKDRTINYLDKHKG